MHCWLHHAGIIQTEQGDDGSNVELVKQLVQQYISSDRVIIVATITCKDDIDDQVSACAAVLLYRRRCAAVAHAVAVALYA